MFPCLKNKKQTFNVGFFSDTIKSNIFKSVHDNNLAHALGIHCHSRFDALDLDSWSQVCVFKGDN